MQAKGPVNWVNELIWVEFGLGFWVLCSCHSLPLPACTVPATGLLELSHQNPASLRRRQPPATSLTYVHSKGDPDPGLIAARRCCHRRRARCRRHCSLSPPLSLTLRLGFRVRVWGWRRRTKKTEAEKGNHRGPARGLGAEKEPPLCVICCFF